MLHQRLFIFLLLVGALLYGLYLKQSHEGYLGETLNAASNVVGQMAPDFEVLDESGQKIALKDLKGNVVLLHFWATWCPPCAAEFPSLSRFVDQFKGQNFKIVAVSLDEEKKDVTEFRKGVQFNFPVYFDPEESVIADKYGTYRLPETYLIGKDGIVKRKIQGPQDWLKPVWQERIKELL